MTTQIYPWIHRQKAEEIYQQILKKANGVHIFLLEAPAGAGKTYVARDIGVRLGSETGYESGNVDGIYWSGIADLYDPETNSKRLEQFWMEAFGTPSRFEFDRYQDLRKAYEISADDVALPSDLEKQIGEIRTAFAEGMSACVNEHYPVIAFDTIERLQTVLDPAQQKLDIKSVELPDLLVWLFHQITHLARGVILLMGRSVPALAGELQHKISQINLTRGANELEPIIFSILPLGNLVDNEIEDFFDHRLQEYPNLRTLLDVNLKSLLAKHTEGNPLLLDIALQTLLETRQPSQVEQALQGAKGITGVEETLLSAYMNYGSSERKNLLIYLAIARNGLFAELLEYLDKSYFAELHQELLRMEKLPFIKVRELFVFTAVDDVQKKSQRTYFLHDEMYAICDRVRMISAEQVRDDSTKILKWYESRIQELTDTSNISKHVRRSEIIKDLMVELLPYRMRSDPESGYRWFLDESEKAIRAAERGLDLRLQNSMAQFMSSASEKKQPDDLPINPIDREILIANAPDLYQDYQIDSVLLWLKRYSVRGRHNEAIVMAQKATWMKEAYEEKPARYFATYIDFLLWQGQSLMYSARTNEALTIYNQALGHVEAKTSFDQLKRQTEVATNSRGEITRICMITGRLHNNRGYLYWHKGMYWLAIREFKQALRYFGLVDLKEEIANSKDNLGRVYASLGYNFQAFQEIGEGLKLRISAKLPYREALSRNSLAIVYARFEDFQRTLDEIIIADQISRRIQVERGIGLAHFTRGVAYRRLAQKKEPWQNSPLINEQALKSIDLAEADLRDALHIFSVSVQEPIRRIQILNEFACCYRARYMLLGDDDQRKTAFARSISYFADSIKDAEKFGYVIDKLDSLQDRAVLYTHAREYDKAKIDIESVLSFIPGEYQVLEKQGLLPLKEGESQVDAYYRLLGQAEALVARIIHEEEISSLQDSEESHQKTLLKMLEHYVLATAYFNAFSSEAFTQNKTNDRIYAKLRDLPQEFILAIRDKYLPNWLEKYNLPAEPIRSQFDGIFNTLLPESRIWGQSSRH